MRIEEPPMPVIALYDFADTSATAVDSATGNGAQNGNYFNGASSSGGRAVLDGQNDIVKIATDPTFQLARGTLEIQFSQDASTPLTESRTILSRDSAGETAGGFRIETLPNGAVRISHESPTGTTVYETDPGFQNPGDEINVSYSWDATGPGGFVQITNQTTGATFDDTVPSTLTMDMGSTNQNWIIGASQDTSPPGSLQNVDEHYPGSAEYFSISDTVDNTPTDSDPVANPDTASTLAVTPVVIEVLANDTDPEGGALTVVSGTAPNGVVAINPDGTITYTPVPGFTGTDTITYDIRDPAGNTATSFVTVTVNTDPAPPIRDGIVEGTAAGDLIDTTYAGDPDGDFIDNSDALLPGAAPNDDVVLAGGGNDTVLAGLGDDSITAAAGDDVVYGGDGNDSATGDTGRDQLFGGAGDDNMSGGTDADTLFGGAGDDSLLGGLGADVVDGGAGSDTLDGGDGDDVLIGGDGADLAIGGLGGDFIDTRGTTSSPDRTFPGLYVADGDVLDDRDTVNGGDGNDTILTGDDRDVIVAGGGADSVDAGDDDDSVQGNDGNDTLIGGEGNDTMTGDLGDDLIHGGTPDDASDPTHLLDAVDPDADNNRDNLAGGLGNDTIYGGDDADTLFGGQGDDLVYGGIDDDQIFGGAGNDILSGGGDADSLTGGADRDSFIDVGPGAVIDGSEEGDDFDTLDLRGQGPLTVTFDPTNPENGTVEFFDATGVSTGTMTFVNIENVIQPTDGAPVANPDTATTPQFTDITIAVLANDTDPTGQPLTVTSATAENGDVTINPDGTITYSPNRDYNGPDDTITYTVTDPDGNTSTSTVAVTITNRNDLPTATDDYATTPLNTPIVIDVLGNDTDPDGDTLSILGTPTSSDGTVSLNPDGTVTFTPNTGFTGAAVISYTVTDGNGGTDPAIVVVQVGTDPARDGIVRGTTGDDLIDETYVDPFDGDRVDADDTVLPGDGPNADRIVAGSGNDTILAGIDNDTVFAGTGDDQIHGGSGDDSLFGEAGDDTIIGGGGREVIEGGDGNDFIDTRTGAPNPDIDYPGLYPADTDPENNRDTVYGGNGNDTIFTGDDADRVFGRDGNDYIDGGVDDDSLFGGAGRDTIIGSEGNDSIDGGRGDDLIFGGLDLTFPDAINIPDDAGDLRPGNNGDFITAGFGNDTIYGQDDDDTLLGDEGNDLIFGGVDDDSVFGGAGTDTLYGDQGNDSLFGGGDADTLFGGIGNDLLEGGLGADLLEGGDGNDVLQGSDGDDTLLGGAGNDTLEGGFEADLMDGGTGNDLLVGDAGADTLTGGAGSDTLFGGVSDDLINLGDPTTGAPDTFADQAFGGADRDTFTGVGAGDTVFGGSEGDDFDVLDLDGTGPRTVVRTNADSDGNGFDGFVEYRDDEGNVIGRSEFTNIESIVCFTPGTLIATPRGEVRVEQLRVGDKVVTRDNGLQEIRWMGAKDMGWQDFAANPHLRPVMVKAGSLGNGLPERDMMLSPNHRLLVANDRTALYFDEHEVLVAAKHLVGGAGVHQVESVGTTYFHFMFDQHEVVLSNGAWTESFQPGDYTLKGLGNAQRSELLELFPELKVPAGVEAYQAARKTLKKHEARLLTR
jgi:Ca2+-binding RTX toxin-like protein